MNDLTPSKIVKELDKYIIGQKDAKKSVAIALRNRYRRKLLSEEMREEITPKNIIMVGPTGVGKTEIARRLAKLVDAPFIKVEATKFTEVGYVGRDVESMIRDLVNTAIRMVRQREIDNVSERVKEIVNERLLDAIVPIAKKSGEVSGYDKYFSQGTAFESSESSENREELLSRRQKLMKDLTEGHLENFSIEIVTEDNQSLNLGMIGEGSDEMSMNVSSMLGSLMPKKKKKRKTTVAHARQIFTNEESQKLIDQDAIVEEGLRAAEQEGIIFLDEIDKIASSTGHKGSGPDVSREGVQRDILPIVEGCTVNTKYGPIKTDFILFIGAGAFHTAKVSDLIPELQGRFPIKVSLDSLTEEDFKNILTQPQNAIIKQYSELLSTEDVILAFEDEALEALAKIAFIENETSENIGARRLFTVMEKLLAEISFYASDYDQKEFIISKDYVRNTFRDEEEDYIKDSQKYII